jgi:hypothetical protein
MKKEIRIYKDLKFIFLRLIHDYYGIKIKWLIFSMLLEIKICELIYYD